MTICLSMIVKNEAHCISKCLQSVKPFIDYWVICDTGSTDNTEEIIKNCLRDIPGELHNHQWEDFSTNRNKSLELARSKADYILVIDADDYLAVSDVNVFKHLSKLAYQIEFIHGSIIYSRVQLFKSSIKSKYVGVLHEYLELPLNVGTVPLEGCRIIFGANGSRSQDPQKYLKDAEVFEKALLTEPDNARYVFYAAQSYRDAGKLSESLKLYMQRSRVGGWVEEQYVSLIEAAKILEITQPKSLLAAETLYLAAYNRQPSRVESLAYLASLCRRNKQFEKAYFYAKIGCQIAKPKDALFLEPACYDWRIIDELAIASYYIGKPEESSNLNQALLKSGTLPEIEKERIINNLIFCETRVY